MKEIRGILEEYDQATKDGKVLALATVYDVKGSSYRRSGARMLIKDDGNWFGGISGGCIEGDALKKANLVMADGQARIVTYDTAKENGSGIGVSLGCNGVISVIIAPLISDSPFNPVERLRQITSTREPTLLMTVLASQVQTLPVGAVFTFPQLLEVIKEDEVVKSLNTTISDILAKGKSRIVELADYQFFVEVILPEIDLLVMGGNYDVLPLLTSAKNLGWQTTVITNPKRLYPPAKTVADQVISKLEESQIDEYCVAVIMSHDYTKDLYNLRAALGTKLNYIGLLGPAVRRDEMFDELKKSGLQFEKERVFGPAGLDIGAMQPEEIAVAIIAEIISIIHQRSAQSLRERQIAIHER